MNGWKKRWCKMDKSLQYLSMARKAGLAELGEEPVGAAARAGKAHVILVASDAGDHTWRRAKSYAAGTKQQCVRISCSKDEMGRSVGRTSLAIAAITDASLALALVKAMEKPDENVLAVLQEAEDRLKQRKKEAKAHERNKKVGKKK